MSSARTAIEIGLELASPRTEVDRSAAGPGYGASAASPALAEQKAEVKETDLPKDRPTESRRSRPDRHDERIEEAEGRRSEDLRRCRRLRPRSRWRRRRPRSRCSRTQRKARSPPLVNQGLGKDKQRLTADWGRKISAYFELHKKYPADRRKETTVKVSLVLNRRGNVVSVDIREPSGDAAFDEAALSMIRRSDPVPLPPAGLTDDQFSFSLDVNFKKPK